MLISVVKPIFCNYMFSYNGGPQVINKKKLTESQHPGCKYYTHNLKNIFQNKCITKKQQQKQQANDNISASVS